MDAYVDNIQMHFDETETLSDEAESAGDMAEREHDKAESAHDTTSLFIIFLHLWDLLGPSSNNLR